MKLCTINNEKMARNAEYLFLCTHGFELGGVTLL